MALTTTITPDVVAVALGQTAPPAGTPTYEQWDMWISDALMLIETRMAQLEITTAPDQAKLDYVIRQAVVAHVQRPDNATQVTTTVDDASVSRTYASSRGRVEILDEWWTLLGLTSPSSGAYSIDTAPPLDPSHLPWCSVYFGAAYCSCGWDIAGQPIFELGGYW
jgi:hypothetical protein